MVFRPTGVNAPAKEEEHIFDFPVYRHFEPFLYPRRFTPTDGKIEIAVRFP